MLLVYFLWLPDMFGLIYPTASTRVGFSADVQPTPISKMGKQPAEDPSVNVIKSILKYVPWNNTL